MKLTPADAEYWVRYRKQGNAKARVSHAIKKGKLTRGGCVRADETCDGRIEGHHEDYDAPLEVIWLCARHHRQLHVEKRRAAEAAA